MDNIIYNDEAIKRLKPVTPRSQYRELHYSDAVILLDMRRTMGGLINNKAKNILVYNFWALVQAYLADTTVYWVIESGTSYLLRSNGDVNSGSAYVGFGSGTSGESYNNIALGSRNTSLEGATLTPTVIQESDKRRLRFGRTANGSATEVGLYQPLFNTNSNWYTSLLGRRVFAVPGAGYNVYYDVIIYPPFLDNFVYYLFGLLTDSNQQVVNLGGGTITARTSGDANASATYLQVGSSDSSFSFSTYSLANPVTLSTGHLFSYNTLVYVTNYITGTARLSSAMTINEVGLVQNIIDASGNPSPVLLARIVLPAPITKSAGDSVTISVVLYSSA
jgi:hypothetical protein